MVSAPVKLQAEGVKRLVEDALWTQGVRKRLMPNKKRHEFQTDHGFRKWFKTRCEMSSMRPINIEILMNHSTGISDSYYRATENELFEDYLRAVDLLTINEEHKLEKQLAELREKTMDDVYVIKDKLTERENEIQLLRENDSENTDAIATLSDKIMKLMTEVQELRNLRTTELT
ncbi:MAG TPA: hypothetical protein VFI73_08215 [Candidatus Nitrosopolaris sp.]|nr:hypothetical protein [Candidatus Nitrosopolaris sp.]